VARASRPIVASYAPFITYSIAVLTPITRSIVRYSAFSGYTPSAARSTLRYRLQYSRTLSKNGNVSGGLPAAR